MREEKLILKTSSKGKESPKVTVQLDGRKEGGIGRTSLYVDVASQASEIFSRNSLHRMLELRGLCYLQTLLSPLLETQPADQLM